MVEIGRTNPGSSALEVYGKPVDQILTFPLSSSFPEAFQENYNINK